jgi:hypothetical protein
VGLGALLFNHLQRVRSAIVRDDDSGVYHEIAIPRWERIIREPRHNVCDFSHKQ